VSKNFLAAKFLFFYRKERKGWQRARVIFINLPLRTFSLNFAFFAVEFLDEFNTG